MFSHFVSCVCALADAAAALDDDEQGMILRNEIAMMF